MASPYTASVTLSSAGTSTQINLDPTAKATAVILSVTGASNSDLTVQGSMWVPGSAGTAGWAAVSSHITSSIGSFADGVYLSLLSPVAGLRLSSTTWAAGSVTMQIIQSVTA